MTPENRAQLRALLDSAHQAAAHDASNGQALQMVLQALSVLAGDSAVFPALTSALERYQGSQQGPEAIQELSSLFAQISVQSEQAAAQPGRSQPSTSSSVAALGWSGNAGNPGACSSSSSAAAAAAAGWPPPASLPGTADRDTAMGGDSSPERPTSSAHGDPMQHHHHHQQQHLHQQHQQQQQQQQQRGGWSNGGGRGGGDGGGGGEASEASRGTPILMETGREGITVCAMEDGSSYVCVRCGGVVPVGRRMQHDGFWCQQ